MEDYCKIDGCEKKLFSRGWCQMHYIRWRKHGNPNRVDREMTPKGAPSAFLNDALKSNTDDCIEWPFYKNSGGYGIIRQGEKTIVAHRVCLTLAYGEPPTPEHQASHAPVICHNRACINPRHLSWKTRTENNHDTFLDGTHNRGERSGRSKLTVKEVRAIRTDTRPHRKIATDYEVGATTIHSIKSGKNWAWLK